MTAVYHALSRQHDASLAVAELAAQLPLAQISIVLFFCSSRYDLKQLAAAFSERFSDTQLVGCTTAGEISREGYEAGSVCAIGFHHAYFSCQAQVIEQLDGFDLLRAQRTITPLFAKLPQANHQHILALTLLDGLSSQEEVVLLQLETALGRIPHFGGSAGDNNQLRRTHVFFQKQFYSNAAVVILLQTALPFQVFSGHHLVPRAEKFVVTAASADYRTVYEIDAEPAATVYSRLVGCDPEHLTATVFALHPLAVKIGQEYYVRSIQRVNADGSLTFYCALGLGAVLTAMDNTPMLPALAALFADCEKTVGPPLFTLGCDCVLRRQELAERGLLAEASAFYHENQVIGFSTYGEHHEGVHLNQTFTGVMFGQPSIDTIEMEIPCDR
ncbi:nitric oxide-sensing protein NosP [Alishewanella tabrizica]|uniref:GfdT protein n=1 Tax=Alishewanella tabrizica TaxID=671278 RepID=A0ABQ2WHI7_9ALTE|nr:nitric oxide-sensing protein NosP [Alishewanella tabrizica]GGW56731.1 hypothetical protein GCM10008111_10840 [Alishewanella tabrizica]